MCRHRQDPWPWGTGAGTCCCLDLLISFTFWLQLACSGEGSWLGLLSSARAAPGAPAAQILLSMDRGGLCRLNPHIQSPQQEGRGALGLPKLPTQASPCLPLNPIPIPHSSPSQAQAISWSLTGEAVSFLQPLTSPASCINPSPAPGK